MVGRAACSRMASTAGAPGTKSSSTLPHDSGTACPLQASVRVHLPFVLTNQDAALTALGDHTRRAIVACLAERPRAVGELADELPVTRPAVSQHLKVLKDAGLVTDRAAGTRRIYRLNPAGMGALRDQLETFWNRALASYKDVVEESREESS
jgi:DNA-binding transcriptional ArsR family regulator